MVAASAAFAPAPAVSSGAGPSLQATRRPLERRLLQAAYGVGQAAKLAYYWSQYTIALRRNPPAPLDPELVRAMPGPAEIRRDLLALLARDAAQVADGVYRLPRDVVAAEGDLIARARRFLADAAVVEERRRARANSEVFTEATRGRFPRYYLQNFHYQSGGWLSPESAELYDHQVEVLFGGAADAMRRQALPPLGAEIRRRCLEGARAQDLRLVDVACGTGRFLTGVMENFPRLNATGIDLSPAYVAHARRLLAPWSRARAQEGAAEALPLPDGSQDMATSIYLFHELPPKLRPVVLAEIRRVLVPGGLFVLVDSIQKGDHPPFDALLDGFPVQFHEPYYADYVRCDLAALATAAGFAVEGVSRAFMSRVMCLRAV